MGFRLRSFLASLVPDAVSSALIEAWVGARNAFASGPMRYAKTGLGYSVLKAPPASFVGKRVCLFSHFDPDDRLDAHVSHYLGALREEGFEIVLISSSKQLEPVSARAADALCRAIVMRENRGLDFAGWALAHELYAHLREAEEILIANDSCYAPVRPLGAMLAAMQTRACDFWGASESLEFGRHLQSFFVWFRKSAIQSLAYEDFWRQVRVLGRKKDVIGFYELRMTRRLTEAGLAGAAFIEFASLRKPLCNPTLGAWRESMAQGSPFLKVQLLRDKPYSDDIAGWEDLVRAGGYDPKLIGDHLRRVAPNAAALEKR